MTLFLHETLDPVPRPGAHTRYLDELGHVVQSEGNARGSAGGICIGAWAPVFLTGRWPRIVTFWEMPDGWDGFGDHFDRVDDLFHEPLERWYGERTGGFDRVLVGASYALDRAGVDSAQLDARAVLQQIVTVEPGGAADYLDELGAAEAAFDPADGVRLVGGYRTAFRRDSEVLVLWAFDSFRRFSDAEGRGAHRGYSEWSTRARARERRHEGLLLRPTSWSPLR